MCLSQGKWSPLLLVCVVITFASPSFIRAADPLTDFAWEGPTSAACCGYENQFDHCGILEFCEQSSTGNGLYGYKQPGGVCEAPGPLIRVQKGKKYLLTLQNTVPGAVTNIHTHGMHISGNGNSDDVTRTVETDMCLHYSWDIPAHHDGGTYWYHAHKHGLTALQVEQGALGMIIVEDGPDEPAMFAADGTTPLSSTQVANIRAFLTNEKAVVAAEIDRQWTGNGVPESQGGAQLELVSGEWTRIRVVVSEPAGTRGAIAVEPISKQDEACEVLVIANDGVFSSKIPSKDITAASHEITGASRTDLAVRCVTGAELTFSRNVVATISVATNVFSSDATPYGDVAGSSWVPGRPYYLKDLRDAVVQDTYEISMSASQINGQSWNMMEPLVEKLYDETQEWSISGANAHPFHLHLYHMQVVSPGGCGIHQEGEWYDTIAANSCSVRFITADIGGRCVFHCHVLPHEDNGAMHWMNVIGGPSVSLTGSDPPIGQTTCGACFGDSCTPTQCTLVGVCGDTCEDDCGVSCSCSFVSCADGQTCSEQSTCLDTPTQCTLVGECGDTCKDENGDPCTCSNVSCPQGETCTDGTCVTSCGSTGAACQRNKECCGRCNRQSGLCE